MTDAPSIGQLPAETGSGNPGGARNGRVEKLRWYALRLRGMSAAEIAHRLHERIKREISARRSYEWADFAAGDGPVPSLPKPDPDAGIVEALRPVIEPAARRVMAGEVQLMGQSWPLRESTADWHLDPATGRHWPSDMFCFDVPFRHDRRYGDPKYMWELNRLQHLLPAAALAHYAKDDAARDFCLAEIESWMKGNPPFNGLAWATGVEVALRTVSLLAVSSFLDMGGVEPETRARLRACLAAHGYWLARYPSRFSSANNHLIAEAAALFLLGSVWSDLPAAPRYLSEGRSTLIEEVTRQIHEDGVGAEQSPTYTAFTLEWYLLALYAGERTGNPLPVPVCERLEKAAEHLRWITDEGGHQPRIGDDDEGRVIASGEEQDYVSSILGCLSAYLERSDLAPPGVRPQLRNLLFGYPQAAGEIPSGKRVFGAGGYTVLRRKAGGRKAMLVMDHGPLGHLSIAAHGHADALALWLHIDGQPVLVDAGTYLYHAGGSWRDAFRGSLAHNTLTLDGRNSSQIAGPFNWRRKAKAWALSGADAERSGASGAHNGYEREFGVVHERRVSDAPDGFTVSDTLRGVLSSPAPAEISYLLHPDLDAKIEGGRVIVSRDGETVLSLAGSGLDLRILKGETSPLRGWYSPRFGEKRPASQIVFSAPASTTHEFVTKLTLL